MIICDLHAHTTFSDGKATIEYLIEKACEGGYKTGISDHLFCDGNNTTESIIHYLDSALEHDIAVGGEANIGEDFLLPDKQIQRFDYLIASVHAVFPEEGKFAFNKYFAMRGGFRDDWPGYDRQRASEYLELSLRQIASHFSRYRVEILGHAGVMPFYDDLPYDGTEIQDWEKDIVALCKKYNVAMEISSMWSEPYERMLQRAHKEGVKFSFGSDCHRLSEVGQLGYSLKMADALKLTDDDLYLPDIYRA